MDNPTPWAALYAHEIRFAAKTHGLDPLVLLAVVWQESHGGVVREGGRWTWSPQRLYRYEPAFWDRYLAGKPRYAPPSSNPCVVEAHKRRVSASYGICQVMFPTAVDLGYNGSPEDLLDPMLSAQYGATVLKRALNGTADGNLARALAAYNTGRPDRVEWTKYDDEVLARLVKLRMYAEAGDCFA